MSNAGTVGFAIPSIPPRSKLLNRAMSSVGKQTYPVAEVAVALDICKAGAGDTRNRAKAMLRTEWTCFLDDDDEVKPNHVESLLNHQRETDVDLVFSWYDVIGNTDPLAELEHIPWNDATPHSFGITVLVRTDLAQSIDFVTKAQHPTCSGEDWLWFNALLANGAHFSHLYERTWKWHINGQNTSGLATRW